MWHIYYICAWEDPSVFPAQPIVRVWGVATVAGGARGSLASAGPWLMHYMGKEIQIQLQKCKSKFKDLLKYSETDNKGKYWQCFYKMEEFD